MFKVKVDWSSASTSIPDTNKDLTLKINFVQDTGNTPSYEGPMSDWLIENVVSEDITSSPTEGLFGINDQGELTTSDNPREYRYIGADPDNYVQFNNELWRIIGIFDGQLKIISDEFLYYGKWDDEDEQNEYGENDWSKASLQIYLNNDYYETIDPEDQTKIDSNYTWKLGGSSSWENAPAQMFYEQERGTDVSEGRPTEWTGSIALMYPSDYGFATSGGSTTNRSSCLVAALYNWPDVEDCNINSWLYDSSSDQWTLTPGASPNNVRVNIVSSIGFVNGVSNPNYSNGARPTLYLQPTVGIVSGIGTSDDPYILK